MAAGPSHPAAALVAPHHVAKVIDQDRQPPSAQRQAPTAPCLTRVEFQREFPVAQPPKDIDDNVEMNLCLLEGIIIMLSSPYSLDVLLLQGWPEH